MESSQIERLERLAALRDQGLLSDIEFQKAKESIIIAPADNVTSIEHVGQAHNSDGSLGQYVSGRKNKTIAAVLFVIMIALGYVFFGQQLGFKQDPSVFGAEKPSISLVNRLKNAKSVTKVSNPLSGAVNDKYKWATSSEVLSLTPEALADQIGHAHYKHDETLEYELNGCRIEYIFKDGAVSYFSASVSKKCRPSLDGSSVEGSVSSGPITLSQAYQRFEGSFVADCLDSCGNGFEPGAYLITYGPHVGGFINVAFGGPLDLTGEWERGIRAELSLAPDVELPESTYQCGKVAQQSALHDAGHNEVYSVMMGVGLDANDITSCKD